MIQFNSFDINNTSFIDYYTPSIKFEEIVARLNTIGIKNNINIFDNADKYKTTFELDGKYGDNVFSLYDYKSNNMIHIGGHKGKLDVAGLKKHLDSVLFDNEPTNFTQKYYYDDSEGNTYSYN